MSAPDQAAPILELADVSKVYRARTSLMRYALVPAVQDVSLTILPRTTTCIMGETGSGKSTIGRLLLGLTEPTSGEVRFRGRSVATLDAEARREYRRAVQLVFQSPIGSFNPMLSIGRSLRDVLRFAPHVRDPHEETARLLDLVGLPAHFADRFPDEVSGGELQRASIARALAVEPSVIFLDEPASALDVSIRGQIFNLLMDLQRDRGLAYVLVTHELGSAEALADRILVLYLGRVVEEAPKDAFFARPAHPYSIGLLAASKVRADTSGTHRPLVVGDAPSVTDPPPGCPFHPRCWLYERLGRPARCREALPLLDEVRPGQSAACHFAQEAIVSGGDVDGGVGSPVVESRGATVTAAASGGAAAPRGGQVDR
jgi:oligopeptide/dipeptide ABC transporter ATP-binding protein